jgi:PAS domain S-box-containing protein
MFFTPGSLLFYRKPQATTTSRKGKEGHMSHWDSASQGVLAVVVSFIVAFLAWVATQALSLPYIYSLPLTLLSALLTGLMLAAWPASRDAPPDESSDPVPAGWARVPADIDEALYWDLFENASDIVFTTDISGRFVTGNRAVERLLGYTVQEAQQLTWEKLVASYEMSKARKMFRRHASGEQFINYELDVVVKSGEIRTFEIGSRPLFEKGELVGFHGIARDVTDRKRIQKAAILARQEAEQASQAKSFFLANMSHEIRTPINGILGFLSLLSKTALDSRQKDFLRPIEQSAKNLLRIVDDILDLSKIEAGKITIKREPVKLADAVLGVVELQRPLALEKKLRLRCDIDWEIPARLLGDGTRIAQVTANLVSNAIKFTERGEINVTARLFDETKHSVKVEIVVRDTGIGIPSHSLERLFEPFRQLDPARDRRSTGSGLGLAITKNLVSAMGGEMQLDSDPGRYT